MNHLQKEDGYSTFRYMGSGCGKLHFKKSTVLSLMIRKIDVRKQEKLSKPAFLLGLHLKSKLLKSIVDGPKSHLRFRRHMLKNLVLESQVEIYCLGSACQTLSETI